MERKVVVILCKDSSQCRHYFEDARTNPKNDGKEYRASEHFLELANDFEHILFLTPDSVLRRLTGFRVSEYRDVGTAYEHKNYRNAINFIKSRM